MTEKYERGIEQLIDQGYGIVEDWFSNDELILLQTALKTRYEADEFKLAAVGNSSNELKDTNIRSDQIFWLNEPESSTAQKVFFERINDFISYLNRTCFAGIRSSEFHYAIYEPGTFYARHKDQFHLSDVRKISMILYLNENWQKQDGGELVIYSDAPVVITPTFGKIVIFRSEIEHEVLLSNFQRKSITGWLKVDQTL